MLGGQVPQLQVHAPRERLRGALVAKGIAVGVLVTLAVAIPIVLGQRGGDPTPVELGGRGAGGTLGALGVTTTLQFEPPPRTISPLQPVPASLLPTTTATSAPPSTTATTSPSTTETSVPSTELTDLPTTAPSEDGGATQVAPATVAPYVPPTPAPQAPPPPPTNPAPTGGDRVFAFPGGQVTVTVSAGALKVVRLEPAARFKGDVVQVSPDTVVVNFLGLIGWDRITIRLAGDGNPIADDVYTEADAPGIS